tara:strand:- start:119 stop:436 length:318 start_codon:yes stop_codon:yes gene_type:complete
MISEIQYDQIMEDVKYSCGDQIREKILEGIRGTGILVGEGKATVNTISENDIDMKVAQALEKVVEDLLGDHILTPLKQLQMLNKLSYSEVVKYQQEKTIPAKFLE